MVRALGLFLAAEIPGANFVVLNRPGAGGETAYVALQSAKPDGYTIGAINTPGYLSVPLERKVRYDRTKIRPIARLVDDPTAFVVRRDSPYRSLQDLVEAARRKPGTISVGSSGVGTDDHLGLTLLQAASGTEFIHAPFAGAGLVKNAVLAGHIDVAGLNLGEARQPRAGQPAAAPARRHGRDTLGPDAEGPDLPRGGLRRGDDQRARPRRAARHPGGGRRPGWRRRSGG